MNNIRQATRQQEYAAEWLAEWYTRVLVGTPNEHGNLILTGYDEDEADRIKWIVDPDGNLLYKHMKDNIAVQATLKYQEEQSTR